MIKVAWKTLLAFLAITFSLAEECRINNMMQDSTLIAEQVLFLQERAAVYAGSPSLLYIPETNEYLMTSDRFGDGFVGQPRNTSIHRKALGKNMKAADEAEVPWKMDTAWVKDQYWSTLFRLNSRNNSNNGDVYLFGTSTDGPAPIKIARSQDFGKTWNEKDSAILFGTISGENSYETGPVPVVEHGGRVYRAFERLAPPFTWGVDYQAVVLHAPLLDSTGANTDLLDASIWKITPPLAFDPQWLDQLSSLGIPASPKPSNPGFLEGNVVIGTDGTVYNMLRFTADKTLPYNWGNLAVLLRLNPVENVLVFDRMVAFPGGHSKFVIRPDPVTGTYITLSNPTYSDRYVDQRNVLTLCSSADLFTWTQNEVILSDDTGLTEQDSVNLTGFHYTEWIFDGKEKEDLLLGIRTAYRGANSYHNSNRILYKRIKNFRKLLKHTA